MALGIAVNLYAPMILDQLQSLHVVEAPQLQSGGNVQPFQIRRLVTIRESGGINDSEAFTTHCESATLPGFAVRTCLCAAPVFVVEVFSGCKEGNRSSDNSAIKPGKTRRGQGGTSKSKRRSGNRGTAHTI